ncbi:hypothetical protein [Mesorhizobium sp. M1252]|uniref:hypothetical protein n=1 Tax=Mesorhizobium sp. M1252 TaxID=2957073 RepID=UPI00333CDA8E
MKMPRAAVAHARQREVTEFLFDNLDQLDIVGLLARRQVIQIRAGLKCIQHGQQHALARLGLGRGGSFVGCNEFGISRLARQAWPALPSPLVGDEAAVGELFGAAVQPLKTNAHDFLSTGRRGFPVRSYV